MKINVSSNLDRFLSRDDTKAIKGIAIILMLSHHLWGFPDRIMGGVPRYGIMIFGEPMPQYFAVFAKICVSLFFFAGGYGMYISNRNKEFDPVKKLKNLYIPYWKVFVVFIPIAFLFFSSQPPYCNNELIYSRYSHFSIQECIANLLGISSSYNGEWWFLYSYAVAIILFPLLRWIIDRHSAIINIFLVIVGNILITNFLPAIGNIEIIGQLNNNYLYSCFWMGAVVAKDGLLDRLDRAMKTEKLLNPVIDVFIWCVIVYLRRSVAGAEADIFYVPMLIVVSMDMMKRVNILSRYFIAIGKQSTNMWLIHSFCCYYFYAIVRIVVFPKWAVPSLMMLVAVSYALSVLLTFFWKVMETLSMKLKLKGEQIHM